MSGSPSSVLVELLADWRSSPDSGHIPAFCESSSPLYTFLWKEKKLIWWYSNRGDFNKLLWNTIRRGILFKLRTRRMHVKHVSHGLCSHSLLINFLSFIDSWSVSILLKSRVLHPGPNITVWCLDQLSSSDVWTFYLTGLRWASWSVHCLLCDNCWYWLKTLWWEEMISLVLHWCVCRVLPFLRKSVQEKRLFFRKAFMAEMLV